MNTLSIVKNATYLVVGRITQLEPMLHAQDEKHALLIINHVLTNETAREGCECGCGGDNFRHLLEILDVAQCMRYVFGNRPAFVPSAALHADIRAQVDAKRQAKTTPEYWVARLAEAIDALPLDASDVV